jgi:hypothetical protein
MLTIESLGAASNKGSLQISSRHFLPGILKDPKAITIERIERRERERGRQSNLSDNSNRRRKWGRVIDVRDTGVLSEVV